MGAPVCQIPTGPTIGDQPGLTKFPAIPQPTDIPSLIVAVSAMRQIVMQLIGQIAFHGPSGTDGGSLILGGLGGGGGGGGGGSQNNVPANNKQTTGQGRFIENKSLRVTNKVRVFNKDDHTQYVDIDRIDRVVWVDQLTNQTIVWTR